MLVELLKSLGNALQPPTPSYSPPGVPAGLGGIDTSSPKWQNHLSTMLAQYPAMYAKAAGVPIDVLKLLNIGPFANNAYADVPGMHDLLFRKGVDDTTLTPLSQTTPFNNQSLEITPEGVYNYLISKGVPAPHAQGMIANIKAESNFNPMAIGDNGTSGGLFQHHADRFAALRKATNGQLGNWQGQIDYVLSEPDTQKYLQQPFTDPREASKWFTQNWERPANAAMKAQQRLAYLPNYPLPQQIQHPAKPLDPRLLALLALGGM